MIATNAQAETTDPSFFVNRPDLIWFSVVPDFYTRPLDDLREAVAPEPMLPSFSTAFRLHKFVTDQTTIATPVRK